MNNLPVVGITTGDPKGIGPEVVAKALADSDIQKMGEYRVFGSKIPKPNMSDAAAAEQAFGSLREAVEAVKAGKINAVVTAPVNKARMRLIDPSFTGHTEFFQAAFQAPVCMLFVAHGWRVSLVTRHIPLAQVPARLNAVEILQTLRMTQEGLQNLFGIMQPVLGIAGLNPHAGEGGVLGDEEEKIIVPAIRQARHEGITVEGPYSPDTLFWKMTQGTFDGVIALYHDQGLIPIKTLAFRDAVQVTLGLPFVRCSVDHGTAESIVGTGTADPHNMKAAIRLAADLSLKRR